MVGYLFGGSGEKVLDGRSTRGVRFGFFLLGRMERERERGKEGGGGEGMGKRECQIRRTDQVKERFLGSRRGRRG